MISHKIKRNNPQICAIMGNCGVLRYETYSIFLYALQSYSAYGYL